MSTVAEVRLWGRRIGAVALGDDASAANFQFDQDFVSSAIQVSGEDSDSIKRASRVRATSATGLRVPPATCYRLERR